MDLNIVLGSLALILMMYVAIHKILEVRKLNLVAKQKSNRIKNHKSKNRKIIIKDINQMKNYYSDWTLLMFANEYSWPNLVVSCLPKLYFTHKFKKSYSLVWKEVLDVVPNDYKYTIIREYCKGQVLKIKMPKETQEIVGEIALLLEMARLNSPFSSYISLFGVINQYLNDYELKVRMQPNLTLANQIENQRKELLHNELNLPMFSAS